MQLERRRCRRCLADLSEGILDLCSGNADQLRRGDAGSRTIAQVPAMLNIEDVTERNSDR